MYVTLKLYYTRFGALAEPYKEILGFDYNRVYFSFENIIQDFELHGWKLVKNEDELYTFYKGD